jgi:hypothetical protein
VNLSGRYRSDYQPRLAVAAQALAVAAAFSLVLPISLISLSFGLFTLFWLLAGDFGERWRRIRANPVAWSPLVLFALVAVGMFYSVANWGTALYWLKKYDKLLLIPMVMTALAAPRWRERVYFAFLAGIGMVVVLTYADALGLWDRRDFPGQRNLFENHILYGALVAPACYFAAHEMLDARTKSTRFAWALGALAGVYSVLFINTGRTGYMALFALVPLFGWQRWRRRGLAAGTVLTAVLAVALYAYSPAFHQRMSLIGEETARYEEGVRSTSVGQRLDYYTGTLELIGRHPVFGGGTGSYEKEYADIAARRGIVQFHDTPHNEYLFIATQLGVVGLAALLAMLFWQWRESRRLDSRFRALAQGAIVTFAVASLFDSMLQDSVVGKFYVLMIGVAYSGLGGGEART